MNFDSFADARPLRHCVALADDHAVVRAGYRRLLELEHDIDVVAEFGDAESAYVALAQSEPCPADLLVLDLSMPGRSGLEMLRRLGQRVPGLRVLVFTMHDSVAMMGQCRDAGAMGFVTKSSEPQVLIAAVRRALRGETVWPAELETAARDGAPHERLSPREFQVLQYLIAGRSVDDIAALLRLSGKTVANYQTLVRQKLGIATAVELLRYAREHGLQGL